MRNVREKSVRNSKFYKTKKKKKLLENTQERPMFLFFWYSRVFIIGIYWYALPAFKNLYIYIRINYKVCRLFQSVNFFFFKIQYTLA